MTEDIERHYGGFFRQYFERIETYLQNLDHAGQKGTVSERAVAELLSDFLPERFKIYHDAVLVDPTGELSRQCDIAISNPSQHPRLFPMKGTEIMPVDVCAGVIEVKANASKDDLKSAFYHSRNVKSKQYNRQLVSIPDHLWGVLPDCPPTENPAESKFNTTPPVHAVWCWKTKAKSLATVYAWLDEAMREVKGYNLWPDMIVFLDLGILWTRKYIVAGFDGKDKDFEDLIQCGFFQAQDRDTTARDVRKYADGNSDSVRISQGVALLHFLWTLNPKLEASEELKRFNPEMYMDKDIFSFRPRVFEGHVKFENRTQ